MQWLQVVLLCMFACMAKEMLGTGQGIDTPPLDAVPATCTSGPHIVMGTPIKWQVSGELLDGDNCSFTMQDTQQLLDSESFATAQPGDYYYQCPEGVEGNTTVVQAQYSVAVCSGCRNAHSLNSREVLQWSFVSVDGGMRENMNCSTKIFKDEELVIHLEHHVRSYQFMDPGTYRVICDQDTSLMATISVAAVPASNSRLIPLLYTHAALMAAAFGFLLPLGAFLAYNQFKLAHKIMQPLGLLLAIAGFVLVVVYVQLTHGLHFRHLIHSVVGLVLLLMAVVGMPLLLIKKPRTWHKKTGQIVAFFGMCNVLLGLAVFPILPPAAPILCAVYGLWLLLALAVYIFAPRSSKKFSSYSLTNNQTSKDMEDVAYKSRNSSFSSLKGPQRLEKNVISENKMIELRKKSIDFVEATRARDQLNIEFMGHPLYNKPFDNGYYSEERRDSKPDQESDSDDLETSMAPLCRMTSQPDSSYPATPDDELGTEEKVRMYLAHSDEQGQSTDDLDARGQSTDEQEMSQSTDDIRERVMLERAQTFNHHGPLIEEELEKGGSVRITRHSRRARQGVDEVFPNILPADEPPKVERSLTLPIHLASNPPPPQQSSMGRRRKGAFVPPPIITTTPVETTDSVVAPSCPFHRGLSVNSHSRSRGSSQSPRPSRRGISPSPSAEDSVFDSSPQPQRKKKVSVAQIEATVVPPTPVNLIAPAGSGLTRAPSHDAMRTQQDVFTDNAFRSVIQISQDAIVCANSVGDIVFWSPGASKMFGYTPGEAIGSNLEMIVPMNFREKHRSGIANRTGETLKYLRKHSYAPEEQKHARLYEVRALTKSGHEIPAEVHVTSFVIEGELFYTGVITEMNRKNGGSIGGSTSDINELSLKQRALAVGAQMKLAHNLMNASHIRKKELERVLVSSLKATDFEVESYQIEHMVDGIMKEGDPDSTGVISFVNLIKLLSKHQLYISESGNIARYGKTKGAQGGDLTRRERTKNRVKEFLVNSACLFFWLMIYLILNLFVFAVGILVSDRSGVQRFAYGAGPVLSLNTVIVVLPTLSSVITVMRSSVWMNKYLPLTKTTLMHLIISCGIVFWTIVHITTHFVSFAVDSDNTTVSDDLFATNLRTNVFPTVTGFVLVGIFLLMVVLSVGPVRRMVRFIPFFVGHWVCLVLFYLILIIHGVNYFNHSYWKWLLPLALVVLVERIYRYTAIPRHSVKVKCAGRYDDQSRTAIIELEKPARFKFEPGQHILLNLPWIGQYNWEPCLISSGPKDQKLTIHLPHSSEPWVSKAFTYLKDHPYHMPASASQNKDPKQKNKEVVLMDNTDDNHPAGLSNVQFTGPFGPTLDSQLLFDYKVSTLVCTGDTGPHFAKAIVKKFLEYRKGSACHCGCTPVLSKLYFIWVVPSGNDFEWFSDYLSELSEDEHVHRYLDIRVFLTNINSPPDELASALLQLGLKTAGPQCIVRRPSQPQLNNLHSKTSYGMPDFHALLDYISAQNAAAWSEGSTDFGVFTVGALHHVMNRELTQACKSRSKPGQLIYTHHHIYT